jgi:hypothetical protein
MLSTFCNFEVDYATAVGQLKWWDAVESLQAYLGLAKLKSQPL